MTFPATYPIKPVHPSPVLNWDRGTFSATRQFLIPCENVAEFVYDMLTANAGTCGLPASFPDFPYTFVDTINVEPICAACMTSPEEGGVITNPLTELEGYPSGAAGSQELEGCECKVVINYVTRQIFEGQSGVREGTWITYEREAAMEVLTLPSRSMFWLEADGEVGDALLPDHQDFLLVPQGDITIAWHFVEEEDLCFTEANLNTMQGKVNANPYGGVLFPGVCADIFPPETLLFMGYTTSLDLSGKAVFGTYCTTIQRKRMLKLHFKYRRIYSFCTTNSEGIVAGWNHAYDDRGRGRTGSNSTSYSASDAPCIGWKRVVDEDGNPRYDAISFANIFL